MHFLMIYYVAKTGYGSIHCFLTAHGSESTCRSQRDRVQDIFGCCNILPFSVWGIPSIQHLGGKVTVGGYLVYGKGDHLFLLNYLSIKHIFYFGDLIWFKVTILVGFRFYLESIFVCFLLFISKILVSQKKENGSIWWYSYVISHLDHWQFELN